jgi:mRNA interferase MazF
VVAPRQGEIWWVESEDMQRPVLVVMRNAAVEVLAKIVVAPVTRRTRGIPTEIVLGPDNGLPVECVASFDNLQIARRSHLVHRLGQLTPDQDLEVCRALRAMSDC